jgi:hypothetical protein
VFDVVASAEDRALASIILAQEGVVSRGQALRVMSADAIRHRLASGRWRRLHTGVYLTFTGPSSRAQRRWIAVLAAGRSALVAGVSALELVGLRSCNAADIHLLVPAARTVTRPPSGVVVHRTRFLPAEDIARANQPPCTSRSRSLIDAAQWAATEADACAIVAAAYQQRAVRHEFVMATLNRLPNVRRRALIEHTALDAAGGSHSLAELNYLALSRGAGLPEPTPAAGPPRCRWPPSLPGHLVRRVPGTGGDRRRATPGGTRGVGRHEAPERPVDHRGTGAEVPGMAGADPPGRGTSRYEGPG